MHNYSELHSYVIGYIIKPIVICNCVIVRRRLQLIIIVFHLQRTTRVFLHCLIRQKIGGVSLGASVYFLLLYRGRLAHKRPERSDVWLWSESYIYRCDVIDIVSKIAFICIERNIILRNKQKKKNRRKERRKIGAGTEIALWTRAMSNSYFTHLGACKYRFKSRS